VIQPNSTFSRMQQSEVLGLVSDIPTRREAHKLLYLLLRPTNQGLRKPQALISFGDFAKKWGEAILPTYRESTRYFYRTVLQKHLVPAFAASRLRDIHTWDIQMFLNQKATSYAPSVVYHIRATLSRIFATATDWGYVDSNPVAVVRMPHKRSVRPNITFEPAAVQRILQRLDEPYRSMVTLAALTGLRASEIFALTWSNVDLDRHMLYVRRTFYRGHFGPTKNRSSERAVPITERLAVVLQNHRRRSLSNSDGLVFSNGAGKPYESGSLVNRVLHPTLKALDLPMTGWRAFRSSVATALSELGEPVRTAQQMLGHSSAQTTLAFYIQSAEEYQRRAMTNLERVMFPNVLKFESGGALTN
jgi:integrase